MHLLMTTECAFTVKRSIQLSVLEHKDPSRLGGGRETG